MKRRLLTLLLIGFVLSSVLPAKSALAQDSILDVKVKVNVSGSAPQETYQIKMVPVDEDAPLPKETKLAVQATKQGEASFSFDYTGVGLYRYRVTQESGTHRRITYDNHSYLLYVNFHGDGTTTVVVKREDEAGKTGEIVFNNTYRAPSGGSSTYPYRPHEPEKKNPEVTPNAKPPVITVPDVNPPTTSTTLVPNNPTSQPQQPAVTNTASGGKTPHGNIQTGDTTGFLLYQLMFIFSAAVLFWLILFGKRRRRHDTE